MGNETSTASAPAAWATLLINGDGSGLDEYDIEDALAWAEDLAQSGWHITGCWGTYVATYCDAGPFCGEVCDYDLVRI